MLPLFALPLFASVFLISPSSELINGQHCTAWDDTHLVNKYGSNPNNQNKKKVPSHSPHPQQCINDSLELESTSVQAQIVEERSARTTNVQISRGRRCKACHYWPVRDYVHNKDHSGSQPINQEFSSKVITTLCYIKPFQKVAKHPTEKVLRQLLSTLVRQAL